jgi:LemA protein
LKANENFIRLQDELSGTENRISVERQRYNSAVQGFNTTIRQMPTALIARLAGFTPRTPFEAAAGAESAPTVQF